MERKVNSIAGNSNQQLKAYYGTFECCHRQNDLAIGPERAKSKRGKICFLSLSNG